MKQVIERILEPVIVAEIMMLSVGTPIHYKTFGTGCDYIP
jgi:hypothetical protein